jgi:hypothetical protein
MIGLGSDVGLMIRQLRAAIEPFRAAPGKSAGY